MPGAVRPSTTDLNPLLLRLGGEVSRWIDNYVSSGRVFYPTLATRNFIGSGHTCLRIPDLISITSVSISTDYGVTYTSLTNGTDYIPTVEGDENSLQSYTYLVIHPNSTNATHWPAYLRGVKIVGVWGYADNRDTCFELSVDTIENNPLASDGASLTVNDVDGVDAYGLPARFSPGQLWRCESEYLETINAGYDATSNTIGISRAANGTTAASHAQNTALYLWRPPEPVKQAAIIQVAQQLERGLQGFGDARATAEVGQLFFVKSLDPAARDMLSSYRVQTFP